jgi:tetratricopeptide (TPR) repeat protein
METIPFSLPESLQGYIKTFEQSPDKAVENLEKYLHKRRYDAVGYFLLALLYKMNNTPAKALEAASKARSLAPGSALLENLHYFLSHPDGFNAWVPDLEYQFGLEKTSKNGNGNGHFSFSLDLEQMIGRLSRVDGKRIKPAGSTSTVSIKEDTEILDKLATPTLARIFENQGKISEAIGVYEKLMKSSPDKLSEYQAEIARLEGLKSDD